MAGAVPAARGWQAQPRPALHPSFPFLRLIAPVAAEPSIKHLIFYSRIELENTINISLELKDPSQPSTMSRPAGGVAPVPGGLHWPRPSGKRRTRRASPTCPSCGTGWGGRAEVTSVLHAGSVTCRAWPILTAHLAGDRAQSRDRTAVPVLALSSCASQRVSLTQQDQHQSSNTSKFVLHQSPNSAEHHSQHTAPSASTRTETSPGIAQEVGTHSHHSPHSTAKAPTCHEPRNVFTEHPPLLWGSPGPWHSPKEPPAPGTAAAVGSGKGLGAPGHGEMGRGLSTAIPSSWEGEGRVKQSAERGRGARRQPGYWKPRWAGSDWSGRGEKLRAPTALSPWVQPGPATSPSVTPGTGTAEPAAVGEPRTMERAKGCLVSSQVNLGLPRENPGQRGSWERSRRPAAPLLLDGSGQQCRVPEQSRWAARARELCWGHTHTPQPSTETRNIK